MRLDIEFAENIEDNAVRTDGKGRSLYLRTLCVVSGRDAIDICSNGIIVCQKPHWYCMLFNKWLKHRSRVRADAQDSYILLLELVLRVSQSK